jgi:hypothetical protein
MLPPFSPQTFDIGSVFVNAIGNGPDLDLSNPIPFSVTFPGTIRSEPALANTNISVAVGSPSGGFAIRDLILFDLGMVTVHDPDSPHPVRIKAYTFAGSHDGPGSIAVGAGQVLVIRVAFVAGPDLGTETGNVLIADNSGVAAIPVSLQTIAPPGEAETSVAADHFSIQAGASAEVPVTVVWKSGPTADVGFIKSEIFLDAMVSMDPLNLHVEPGQTSTGLLKFHADAAATTGTFDFAIQQFGGVTKRFLGISKVTVVPAPSEDVELQKASSRIQDFWTSEGGILVVGTPTGPVARDGGRFLQPYSAGFISLDPSAGNLNPASGVFDPASGNIENIRTHVTVKIAAVRCFAPDDPGGDEPYIIASVYTIDPALGEQAQGTVEISGDVKPDVTNGDVIFQDRVLATDFVVPGDGDIRISVRIYDAELLGKRDEIKQKAQETVHDAIQTGLEAVGSILPAAIGPILSKASGILDAVGGAIGSVLASILGDDFIDQKDFVVSKDFIKDLRNNPASLDRHSDSIPGVTFNFPPLPAFPEDASAAGRGWLFDGGEGGGQYRVFFNIVHTE